MFFSPPGGIFSRGFRNTGCIVAGVCGIVDLMKQYVIDGLRLEDYHALKTYLDDQFGPPALGNIYWIELSRDLLTPIQQDHDQCGPHVIAVELDERALSCELLVRIKKNVKCDCMGYATSLQREWLINTVDTILDELEITI